MKVCNLNVDVIAVQNRKGLAKPLRFRFIDDNQEEHVIKNIVTESYEQLIVNKQQITKYVCKAIIRDCLRIFELTFNAEQCAWTLTKF